MRDADTDTLEGEASPSNPLLGDKKGDLEDGLEFSDFFSLRKPKDVRAGLASGVKSIGKGVVGGTASLIAAPIVCATQDGFRGFAKGLAVGVAGAAVLPVVGVAVGAAQITRGLYYTPEAILENVRGRYWDQVKREWVDEEPMPLATQEQVVENSRNPFFRGSDTVDAAGYYEVLEVPTDAPPDLIKRQYYLLARKYHPDKNLNDPEAHARFQKLGEAYQVLADPQLRKRYDVNGREGVNNTNFMDGVEFFGMIFGCDQFEYLIGELFLATTARAGGDMFDPAIKRLQHERVEKLAINLKALLQRWVHGDHDGFKIAQKEEAERLAELSFGKTMLFAIGRVYQNQGQIYEGDIVQSTVARLKQKGESIKSHFHAAQLTVRAFQAQRKLVKMDDNPPPAQGSNSADAMNSSEPEPIQVNAGNGDSLPNQQPNTAKDADIHKLEEDTLPLVLEAMWAANLIDIQNTLKKVCRRVLTEGNPEHIRTLAQGLSEMGRIFSEAGTPARSDTAQPSAKQTVEDAMLKVVEKRHQMDEKLYGDN